MQRTYLPIHIILLLITTTVNATAEGHTITSGGLVATFSEEDGLSSITLGDQPLWSGQSTHISGNFSTLTRHIDALRKTRAQTQASVDSYKLNQPHQRFTSANSARPSRQLIAADEKRFVVQHTYENGLAFTFSHAVEDSDITCKITITNDSKDDFQLEQWMNGPRLKFATPPTRFGGTGSAGYPNGDAYSPAVALWDNESGIGVNWIEHRCRPIRIRVDEISSQKPSNDKALKFLLWNSPTASGGRTQYTVVFRLDKTPGDWKHLLHPYKKWFNDYFGSVTYNTDFRIKVLSVPSNDQLISLRNPRGTRHGIDIRGWGPYIQARLLRLKEYDISHIIFWPITSDPRGGNYRPEFNVIPPAVRKTMPVLRQFCRNADMGFGWFARPSFIPYQMSWTEDAGVTWNPLDPRHVLMMEQRFADLLKEGATAFYLDTYGSTLGDSPMSAEANVAFLKRLRELTGPDCLICIEHGFDAQHLFAAMWPVGADELGKKPLGDYARWLSEGTVEICRVKNVEGAQRAWEHGGVPAVLDNLMSDEYDALQKKYVTKDWRSIKRPDCNPAKTPAPPPESALNEDHQ